MSPLLFGSGLSGLGDRHPCCADAQGGVEPTMVDLSKLWENPQSIFESGGIQLG